MGLQAAATLPQVGPALHGAARRAGPEGGAGRWRGASARGPGAAPAAGAPEPTAALSGW